MLKECLLCKGHHDLWRKKQEELSVSGWNVITAVLWNSLHWIWFRFLSFFQPPRRPPLPNKQNGPHQLKCAKRWQNPNSSFPPHMAVSASWPLWVGRVQSWLTFFKEVAVHRQWKWQIVMHAFYLPFAILISLLSCVISCLWACKWHLSLCVGERQEYNVLDTVGRCRLQCLLLRQAILLEHVRNIRWLKWNTCSLGWLQKSSSW